MINILTCVPAHNYPELREIFRRSRDRSYAIYQTEFPHVSRPLSIDTRLAGVLNAKLRWPATS